MKYTTKNINRDYNAQIRYTEMQATVLKAVWDADGDCLKAAQKLEWSPVEVQKIFGDQKTCIMKKRLREKGVRLSRKEIAHLGWQKMQGILLGLAIWKSQADCHREANG